MSTIMVGWDGGDVSSDYDCGCDANFGGGDDDVSDDGDDDEHISDNSK